MNISNLLTNPRLTAIEQTTENFRPQPPPPLLEDLAAGINEDKPAPSNFELVAISLGALYSARETAYSERTKKQVTEAAQLLNSYLTGPDNLPQGDIFPEETHIRGTVLRALMQQVHNDGIPVETRRAALDAVNHL